MSSPSIQVLFKHSGFEYFTKSKYIYFDFKKLLSILSPHTPDKESFKWKNVFFFNIEWKT